MKLKPFNYLRPKSLNEAVELMDSLSPDVKIMAGGTDVLVEMGSKGTRIVNVVSLDKISDELSYITEEQNGELRVGALTTHRQLEKSSIIEGKYAILHDAVSQVGSVQIRNVATLGGNICSSLPSADSAAPLIALNAKLNIISKSSERTIDIKDFFTGPGQNILENGEIVKEIIIPPLPPNSAGAYIKHCRRKAMELPLVGVAAFIVSCKDRRVCEDAKIAFSSSAPTPCSSRNAEKMLVGQIFEKDILLKSCEAALEDVNPRSSFRTTEEYRKSIIPVLVERAIKKAYNRLESNRSI